jgi:heat shock protein HtpX
VARTRYQSDSGLVRRMFGTMFGLGLLYVILIAVLLVFIKSTALVIVLAGGILFFQWYFSDTMAMRSMRAVEVTPEQAPQLHAVIDRLCALADMPKPRVAISDMDIPNAFATGRTPKRAVVCVTTGLLRRLDVQELEGVLSHELSHVAHRDVTVMTLASFAGVLAGLLARVWMFGGMGGGRNNRNGNNNDSNAAVVMFVVLIVSVVIYALAFLLTRSLGRYRELSADRTGALLTGNPSALASALQKVSGDMAAIPDRDLRQAESVSAFAFAPAFTQKTSLSKLFMTHPPLEKRLEQLAKISAQLGQR